MNKSYATIIKSGLIFSICLLSSCKKENITPTPPPPVVIPGLTIPQNYENVNFSGNAKTQIDVVNQLIDLTKEAQKGRIVTNTLTKSALDGLFTASNPSLAAVITPYFKAKLEGTNGWFDEIAKASGNSYVPSATISGNGGVFGTGTGAYLFDENGVEMEQLIEKGQFGATLYKHATDLMAGTITLSTVDQLIAIFGATPSFANSGSAVVAVENRDKGMANYAARRDKNDGNGFYSKIKVQFITLQAAIKGGSNYNKERDAALSEIRLIWEKVNAATIINYCHAVTSTMSATSTTDNQKAAALHAYGECVGFTHGWRTIPQSYKKITDTQIDEVLVLLNAPYQGTPTSYKFITDPATELTKLTSVITKLQVIYGFSAADVEDFKKNWVTEQKR